MSSIDHTLSAHALTQALAEGRIGSRELLEHYLARIAQRNASVNAVIALNAEQAREKQRNHTKSILVEILQTFANSLAKFA